MCVKFGEDYSQTETYSAQTDVNNHANKWTNGTDQHACQNFNFMKIRLATNRKTNARYYVTSLAEVIIE